MDEIMALKNYDKLLDVIQKFREKKIPLSELAMWLRGTGSSIGDELEYKGNFEKHIDAWIELIEFCYPEDEWHELGCSICNFFEDAIINESRPLVLPKSDRVVREQGLG
jgi:hypothetical protein